MITLIPAYGRKYLTEEDMLMAWIGGKDFQISGGPYCSIRDIEMMKSQFEHIQMRYGEFGSYHYTTIWESQMHKILGGLTTEV